MSSDHRLSENDVRGVVWDAVQSTRITDIHTHLFSEAFGDLLLWGIDEMLTYHYLVAEVFRVAPMPYDAWWKTPKREQADYIWRHMFVERSPVGESARGVLTTLAGFGLDPHPDKLEEYRRFFASRSTAEHIDDVFERAGLDCVVMTNNPFNPDERRVWQENPDVRADERFLPALRIDNLIVDWKNAASELRDRGYGVQKKCGKKSAAEVRRFLCDWIDRMEPVYMAASLPPDFDPFLDDAAGRVFRNALLPVAAERGVPMAMMIGVNKLSNPDLVLAGDSVGKGRVDVVERLCREYGDVKFLVTMLARENQHELCVAARKWHNLMPFGCWWFLNIPELIGEMTAMRTELLGLSYVPQHSDARVLDQVVYKWRHSRNVIGWVLQEKFCDLARTGWPVTEDAIRRDVARLFGQNFWDFLHR